MNESELLKEIICTYYLGTLSELEKAIVNASESIGYAGSIEDMENIEKRRENDRR